MNLDEAIMSFDENFRDLEESDENYDFESTGSGALYTFKDENVFNKNENILDTLKFPIEGNASFFLTGSRAWGIFNPDSDYDFICDLINFKKVLKRLEHADLVYFKHPLHTSLYTGGADGLFNIIALNHFEIEAWKFATNSIKAMVVAKILSVGALRDKCFKYSLFEIFKSMYRLIPK